MKRALLILLLLSFIGYINAQIRVACVGNSITYGMRVENREQNCYPTVLQNLLGAGFEVGNFGLSGATLLARGHNPYIRTKQYAQALAMKPDVVIIHLGTNDTDPRNYPIYQEQFQSDYLALIQSFRDANPAARIIIARLTPISQSHPRFKAGTREWYDKIQIEIERIARVSNSELIDFQEVLYARQHLMPDAVHPNAEGASLLAKRVYSAITGDFGGLQLSPLYADNMVLQRSDSTLICGLADATELVEVTLFNTAESAKWQTRADKNGRWSMKVTLGNYGGYTLKVLTGKRKLSFRNVAVGEVWLLSGQSNMSWAVGQSATPETAKPSDNIRLFSCNPSFPIQDSLSKDELERLNNLDYIRQSGWKEATADALKEFSAVGYYFAQAVASKISNVRIGLVQTSLGGATAEAFVSRHELENDNLLVDMLRDYRTNPMIMQWCRDVMANSLKGSVNPLQRHYFEPAYLYESRIAPIRNYTIQGVLWYQGESNAENTELHESIFPAVVRTFRTAFGNPQLPFYFVQLSSMSRPSWCRFRDSQRRLAERIDNCEMVVSSDHGHQTDVHPRTKDVIGERLANVALARDYGFSNIEYRSARAIELIGSEIRFANTSGGFKTSDGDRVRGFETAGDDMIFAPVEAEIMKDRIVLHVKNPKHVRYGWQPFTDANLSCDNGLPVSTFEITR